MTNAWDEHYRTGAGMRWWPNEELIRAVSRRDSLGEVLEVGCGNGANLWFLNEHSTKTVGLDANDVALDQAAFYLAGKRDCPDVELIKGDALDLPFEPGSFDTVVDCMVSQHFSWEDHVAAYREYRRVLKPGGWLFLYHLDNRTTEKGRPGRYPYEWERLDLFPDAGLVCLPRPSALAERVIVAGFKAPVSLRGLVREYGLPDCQIARYTVLEAEAEAKE